MSEMDVSKIFPGWSAEGVLGSGEFGTVYLIRNAESGAFSSMKVLRVPPAPEAIDNAVKMGVGRDLLTTYFTKFKNDLSWEIAMYGNVRSSSLAPVEEFKTASLNGPGWLGFLRSGIYTPLSTYFEKTPSTPADAVRMGTELSDGLEALTPYGMVHGDIKPENVMVTDAGGFVLADYAIRRCLERAGNGIFDAGDKGFDAPETVGRDRVYSARSDIYSLGALMCWTANGGSMPEHGDPALIRNIDPALSAVIKKAMAADPDQRYQTAAQLKADLVKLNFPKKQPRRAMAAAAAFEAVKRNGGAVMTGAKPAGKTEDKSSDTKAAAGTAADDIDAAGASARDFSDKSDRSGDGAYGEKSKDNAVKKSKVGWIVGAAALLACLAVILVIWTPWKSKSPADDPGTPGVQGGEPGSDNGIGDGENDMDKNTGEIDPNGGETDPGDETDPDGENDPGGENNENGGAPGENGSGGETDNENSGAPGENGSGGEANAENGGNSGENGSGGEIDNENSGAPGENGSNEETSGEDNANTGENGGAVAARPEAVNDDVLYPSDTQRMTREELEGKTRSESAMLINEIYARHGYIFGSEGSSTQQYFNSQKWYTPVTASAEEAEAQFNDVEKANIRTLTDYQKEMGWRGGGTGSSDGTGSAGNTGSSGTVGSEAVNDDVLYPSDTQRITRAELEGKTRSETAMLINEIYARHGLIFKSGGDADRYFRSQKWYTPVTSDSSQVEAMFNSTEKANITALTDYQKEMGWRAGKPSGGSTTANPGNGETAEPNNGETAEPNNGETAEPNNGETAEPGGGETAEPNNGETAEPNNGETAEPSGGETAEPGNGETAEPGNGETTEPGAPADNTYLFPSDSQLITRADLEGKSRNDVTLIINEIYARHGYIFSNQSLKDYFGNRQWYTPVTPNIDVVVGMLNATEQTNANFINDYMHEMGWR